MNKTWSEEVIFSTLSSNINVTINLNFFLEIVGLSETLFMG